MTFHSLIIAGLICSGLTLSIPTTTFTTPSAPNTEMTRTLSLNELPKAHSTGEWLSTMVGHMNEGDRLDGSVLRMLLAAEGMDKDYPEMMPLFEEIDFLEAAKPNRDKLKLVMHLKGEENFKHRFPTDEKDAKVTLRHKTSRLMVERLGKDKVMLRIFGIGAVYGGKPIPERLMKLTIKADEMEMMEVAGFDIDSSYDLDLPPALKAD